MKITFTSGKAQPFIEPLRDLAKHGMTPAEYAERKRQRTLRVCTVCGPTNNKFEKEHNVCIKCRSQQKLRWQHEHPRRRKSNGN